jgi:MFS family permease
MRWLARIVVLALIAALALAVLPRLTSDVGGPLNVLLTLWVGVTLSVWVLVAVAAGWLAEEKGRSPVIWFLIGLLSGPFAVLLAGFAPRGASGDYRRCKDCREPIRREAVVCPFCRASMPTEVALD